MRFVLAGASGFLGTAWRDHLAREGHDVVRLVRGEAMSANESTWDPYAGTADHEVIESADVVACLSGAPLGRWPYTRAYQSKFRASRVATTGTLAKAVAESDRKPALLAQCGTAGYGDRGDQVLTEDAATDADTFMGGVCRDWEDAARPAAEAGARVVVLRTSPVLDRSGGALPPIKLIFQAGLGAPVGSGRQFFPTISMHDWVRAATWLAANEQARGPYNMSGPEPRTNAEFGRVLAAELGRPYVFRVPGWPVEKVLGAISSEVLGSQRIEPRRLLDEGFTFEHDTLEKRLRSALAR
ncbi:MAG TPA: TIGR01777 family oxidoreductase [Nocardioides sp.]|uniref:TIGR01777 family oxidoreductase n=1 Tax=Nocardioides sp. TaxID=35761 RepID=UPI002D8003B6|nr:TIGR01777 family oxidoreductase [Nocardioides sp.]HET6654324.1 TIGR01777 family oxidoreductase [Nocardioides sp.]